MRMQKEIQKFLEAQCQAQPLTPHTRPLWLQEGGEMTFLTPALVCFSAWFGVEGKKNPQK